jgi:hypothetical protein
MIARFAQRFLPHVPLSGPGEHVVGDPAGIRHPRQAEVGGVADQHGDQVPLQLGGAGLLAAGVGEAVQIAGTLVHLDQQ